MRPVAVRRFALDNLSGWSESAVVAAISILVAVPCFWLPGSISSALSGHAYHAWLAGEIRQGRAPGLELATSWTNVLAGGTLEMLSRLGPPDAAVGILAAAAALLFFWSAFFMLNAVSGRRPWTLLPLLGILTYGAVFHLGLLDHYLSAGLSFWMLGLLWRPSLRRVVLAAPLAALAQLAHPVPLAWAAAVLCYLRLFRKAPAVVRLLMPVLGIVGMMAAQQALAGRLALRWSWSRLGQVAFVGADQAWIYDDKYALIAGGVLLCMISLLMRKLDEMDFVGDPALQIWILHLAASVLLSGSAGLRAEPVLLDVTTSFFVAISFLMMVAHAEQGYGTTRMSGIVALTFLVFLYLDSAALQRAQEGIARLLRAVPVGARVVVAVSDEGARVNGLAHAASQACIGHCFSYADRAAVSGQSRIRPNGQPGGTAAPDTATVQEIERGEHVVTPAESPLYAVCACGPETSALCLRRLERGERICAGTLPVTVRLWRRPP